MDSKKQYLSTFESLTSRRALFEKKLNRYLTGGESAGTMLQSLRTLLETEQNYQWVSVDYYFNIVSLDAYCGTIFQRLGITVE